MNWILGRLACGNAMDAAMCQETEIDCIYSLCEDRVVCASGIRHIQQALPHEQPWDSPIITKLVRAMQESLFAGQRILVHCQDGVTQSPALSFAYLLRCGFNPTEGFRHIVLRRPQAKQMNQAVLFSVLSWWVRWCR